eukprot:TRINITY_DN20494_c0_g1_i7.p1 TRINITY_DN20494_c0_g1~~TRINITY_DN20494_c0_g1_i7.p1  ORF type:complete len:151 (-),score=24.88 TRINITY_DN20494_c0_g1_i7:657-1109(-)
MSPLICKSGGSCSGGVQARFFVAPTDNATLDGMVARESAEHGDIVTVRHAIDGYSAIAAKSLAIVEEGERAGAAWVFKTDDDAFVQVDKLVAWLMTLPDGPVYAGNIECFSDHPGLGEGEGEGDGEGEGEASGLLVRQVRRRGRAGSCTR